jgi:hypothetical protein
MSGGQSQGGASLTALGAAAVKYVWQMHTYDIGIGWKSLVALLLHVLC